MSTRNRLNYPGVRWDRRRKAYRATLNVNGVPMLLGYYLSEDEAYTARTQARRVLLAAGIAVYDTIPNRGRRMTPRHDDDRRKNAR